MGSFEVTEWTREEMAAAVEAVRRSPSVHNTEHWSSFPDPARPDEVARVRRDRHRAPTEHELAQWQAISSRSSHRGRFGDTQLSEPQVRALAGAVTVPGVHARPVHGRAEAAALADVLGYAA